LWLVIGAWSSQSAAPRVLWVSRDDSSLVSTATAEGRLVVFDDVWETIQERYYDPKFHGVDWQAKRDLFRPAAARASSPYEFYEVLRQMIASLKDAHTRVYSPDEKFDWWNPRFVTVGLGIREVEGAPTVIQVEPGSAAAQIDIRRGDVITKVDDVSVADLAAKRSGMPEAMRARTIANIFDGPAGTAVKVGWITRNDKQKSAVLPRYWSQRQLGFSNQRRAKSLCSGSTPSRKALRSTFQSRSRMCSKAPKGSFSICEEMAVETRRRWPTLHRFSLMRESTWENSQIVRELRLNCKPIRSDFGACLGYHPLNFRSLYSRVKARPVQQRSWQQLCKLNNARA